MRWGTKLGVAATIGILGLLFGPGGVAKAQNSQAIKPYVLVIFDVSGSMFAPTNQGISSCGGADTRIDHAKCAIQKVVDAHSDIQFGMGRFRMTPSSASSCFFCEENTAIDCSLCNNANGSGCTANMKSADRFQLLVPFVPQANVAIKEWTNFNCGPAGCTLDPANSPELRVAFGWSFTPLGGVLRGAQRFFQGGDTNITSNASDNLDAYYGAGIDTPIASDPLRNNFIAVGKQCRPYVVILLTDGEETCEQFDAVGGTVDVASGLLTTPFGGSNYRIQTRPIGFGILPGNAQIEALARAGGTPGDGPGGANEGLYATNEVDLINAFNKIISDSILVEICDGVDNDCDGLVDEGFQLYCNKDAGHPTQDLCLNPGDDCDGSDDNCAFGIADEVFNACGVCGPVPVEVCNLSDDDCDGLVDEDANGVPGAICNGCVPIGQEICNNLDDNCDGQIDEGITRPCGTDVGVCTAGTETCVAGVFVNCTASGGSNEVCDGVDNDCNGIVDGFVRECSALPGNTPPYSGVCQPGFQVCPIPAVPGIGNSFGACQGEIGPSPESCDLLDNDCDGLVDEQTGGADCSTTCGTGTTQCVSGVLECSGSGSTGTPEVCNGIDDDCNGVIDDNVPDPVPSTCDEGGTLCVPGVLKCIGGAFVCTGGVAPGIEICDCLDNDCDGLVDEGQDSLCPNGSSCTNCQCALPCRQSEFPCPVGFVCNSESFCIVDQCADVICTPTDQGAATTCVDGSCVEACSLVQCPTGTACRSSDGTCQFDDCRGFPDRCVANEFCVSGQCVSDPCSGVACTNSEQYCFEGTCVDSCATLSCPSGQACSRGQCEPHISCNGPCPRQQVCNKEGVCVRNPCTGTCTGGQVCDPDSGDCVQDPCLGVRCPGGQFCDFGSCFAAGRGDGGLDRHYVNGGGGGRGCSSGGSSGPLGGLLLLLLLSWAGRREETRS